MSNILNHIQNTFYSPDEATDAIDWERLDYSPYERSYTKTFRERYGKFPEEFYVALEEAEAERKRLEKKRFILKHGLLKVYGSFKISFK